MEIWRLLVRQWKRIIAITIISVLAAVAYALLTPHVYKAEVFILPPFAADVEKLNIHGLNLTDKTGKISAVDLYAEALKNLQSLSLRRVFFDEHNLLDLLQADGGEGVSGQKAFKVFVESFQDKLKVARDKKDRTDFVTVSLEGTNPEQIASWLNTFLSMVNAYTRDGFVQKLQIKIQGEKTYLENKINELRQTAENRRMDKIAALQEALSVASQLGIVQRAETTILEPPLYLRGTRELQAEIDILQKRKNEDPFIENLRPLQSELAKLNQIEIAADEINAIRIDQLAMVPQDPIKPKRKLIVVLGAVLGLMLGIFVAFFVNFIETVRPKESAASGD